MTEVHPYDQEVIARFYECLSERTSEGFVKTTGSITRQDLKLAIEALERPRPVIDERFRDKLGRSITLDTIVRHVAPAGWDTDHLKGRLGLVVSLGNRHGDDMIGVRFAGENFAREIHPSCLQMTDE